MTITPDERSVIAAILEAEGANLPAPVTRLLADAPATFDDQRLGIIAVAVRELVATGKPANIITVKDHLGDDELLNVGGWEYLAGLKTRAHFH